MTDFYSRSYRSIFILLFTFLSITTITYAAPRPQSITVVMDNNYPPYVFQDNAGKLQGILIDQWHLWEQKTGITAEIHAMDWGEALGRMQTGEFDVIDTVFKTKDRSAWLDFSPPFAEIDVPIFFHENISGITDASSLKGFVVGVKTGDAAVDLLKRHGIDNLLLFNSYEAVIQAVKEHTVNVFVVDKPPALYFLYKSGIQEQFKQSAPLDVGEFHRAVRKNSPLLTVVNEGFARISQEELQQIDNTWLGSPLFDDTILRYLFVAGVSIGVLILGLFVWNHMLRQAVNARAAELKTSEERLQAIYNSVNDAIFVHDGDTGAILDVNQAMLDMFGYTKEEALRMTVAELSLGRSPYSQKEAVEHIGKAVSNQPQVFEWHSKDKNGRIFPCEVALKSCSIGAHPIVTAVVRDISDRKRLEAQLQQSHKMEAIGTLAGGIAHDFNNILAPILGYTELAMIRVSPHDPLAADLQQVVKAALRAKDLVTQILAFSRQSPQDRIPLQPHLVVKETLKLLRASLPSTIEIRENISDECGTILADPTQMHQIIMNLCTNAYQAMRKTGGLLGVSLMNATIGEEGKKATGTELTQGEYVLLEISDTGGGMDHATLTRIFEPYFTTKATGEGTGLGLSVVHGIVKNHQGHITVSSEPGQGTDFHVYLPRVTATTFLPVGAVSREIIPTGTERVLVVDDEEEIAGMLQVILHNLGYRVTISSDSQEALTLFKNDPNAFDLMITDMTMPNLTGAELTKKMLAMRPDLPVILCTGFSELINKEQALAMGIRTYLLKPVSVRELSQAVRTTLIPVEKSGSFSVEQPHS